MSQARILVVEDQHFIRIGISALLNGAGYKVAEAQNGEEGLELAMPFRPDAVTINYHLPDTTGLEFAKELRRRPGFESTPFILITSEEMPGDCDDTPLPHITAYLPKADLIDQLLPCIESHLRGEKYSPAT